MKQLGLVLSVVLAVAAGGAVGAGCGSATSEDATAQLVRPGQVVQRFQQQSGKPLLRTAEPDVAWEQLGYGLDPPKELLDRYGVFSVYVVKAGHLAALGSLLKDKATKQPLDRDPRGVYWELDSQNGTWIAYKRYGKNVVLVWFSGSKTRATDVRWQRLDRVLRGLPG